MIYTITLNPALDYILKVKDFQTGEINKSSQEIILPGGKGINVSIILKELGIASTAIAYVAGFVGEKIEEELKTMDIQTDFIKIENEISRMNIKIVEENEETAIDGKGPHVTEQDLQVLYKKVEEFKADDFVILAGSIPRALTDNVYANIIKRCNSAKIIVDATGELLLKTLKYKPFLIKPNKHELGEIFNTQITTSQETYEYAKKLQQKGAKNVLVSLGKEGAFLIDENGRTYQMEALDKGKRINTVGAGDSMVAGFIAGYELFEHNYEKALKMGMAAGAATANSIRLATREEIYKLFNKN